MTITFTFCKKSLNLVKGKLIVILEGNSVPFAQKSEQLARHVCKKLSLERVKVLLKLENKSIFLWQKVKQSQKRVNVALRIAWVISYTVEIAN